MIEKPILDSLNCDGSFLLKSGKMSWRVCDTLTGEVLMETSLVGGSSNIAEFLAIVNAIEYQYENGMDLPIYTDSICAMIWVSRGESNSWFDSSIGDGEQIQLLLDQAEEFLANCSIQYEVLKWNTREWGNILSDFGNKYISKESIEKTKRAIS